MIAWYATGVWAYCESPVVVRGFYALNDYRTPVRLAAWMVGLNLALNLTLIWPMAEAGLAVSTSITAAVQVLLLMAIFSRRQAPLGWRRVGRHRHAHDSRDAGDGRGRLSGARPAAGGDGLTSQMLRVGVPLVGGHGGLLRRLLVAGRTRVGYADGVERMGYGYGHGIITTISHNPMKQIIAVVKPYLVEKVLDALKLAPVEACGVCEVKGYGRQKSYLDEYRGSEYSMAYLPKVEITLWVDDLRVEEVVRTIVEVARTGRMGDGKIFVLPMMGEQIV